MTSYTADLLRYYWFRLTDVALPLGVALEGMAMVAGLPAVRRLPSPFGRGAGGEGGERWSVVSGQFSVRACSVRCRIVMHPRPFTGVSAAGGIRPVLQHGFAGIRIPIIFHSRCHARSRASRRSGSRRTVNGPDNARHPLHSTRRKTPGLIPPSADKGR